MNHINLLFKFLHSAKFLDQFGEFISINDWFLTWHIVLPKDGKLLPKHVADMSLILW